MQYILSMHALDNFFGQCPSCLIIPGKRSHPPLQEMLILCSSFWSLLSVKGMIHFLYPDRKRSIALSLRQSSSPSPHPVFQNSIHRQFMLIKYAFSRWSSGNRRRATSAREVIEVAGSNHAIGVILNLAWGPNNFSPSMIWSWRTRSNSRTGLGAELLLPAEFAFFFFAVFLLFPPVIIIFICFSFFPFSFWAVEMDLFSLKVFCVLLPLLHFLCFIYNKLVICRYPPLSPPIEFAPTLYRVRPQLF